MTTAKAIQELRRELKAIDAFEPAEAATWMRFGALMLVLAGLLTAIVMGPLWLSIVLIPPTAFVAATGAMFGHEGGHRSLSRNNLRNDLMFYISFPLLGGLSAIYWSRKHNAAHHGMPNVTKGSVVDPDLDLWPMAVGRAVHDASHPMLQAFQRRAQGGAYIPLTFFLIGSMRVASIQHLWDQGRNGRRDARYWADVACMVGHHALWFGGGTALMGLGPAVAVYIGIWGLVGMWLAAVFSPAHLGLPMVDEVDDPRLLQLQTTQNLLMPRWLSWAFVGLNYQVEHHLFPRIPHLRMPAANRIVKAWALRHEMPYKEVSYFKALRAVPAWVGGAWALESVPQSSLTIRSTPLEMLSAAVAPPVAVAPTVEHPEGSNLMPEAA